jgi:putative nucleotidyltransferase with HDIG domain
MNLVSLKNFRLFKPSSYAGKPDQKPGLSGEPKSRAVRPDLFHNPLFYCILFSLLLAIFISYKPQAKALPELKEGEIATSDITVPADMTIEDAETTEARQREAAEAVLPVYVLDPNVYLNTEEKVRRFFEAGRAWLKTASKQKDYGQLQQVAMDRFGIELAAADFAALDKEGFSADLETTLLGLLEKYSTRGLILSKSLFIHKEDERGFTLVRPQEDERIIKPADIFEIKEAKNRLVEDINALELTARKKGLLISLSFVFLAPNVSFTKVETDARRELAKANVEKVFYSLKKGKVLIRKGDEAGTVAVRQVRLINDTLRVRRPWFLGFVGTFFLLSLLLIVLWFYLDSFLSRQTALKDLLMIGFTVALALGFDKLLDFFAGLSSQSARFFLFADAASYRLAFPFQFGTLLFAFLASGTVALIFTVLNALLVGYIFGADYFLLVFCLIGGLAAIYGTKVYGREKRTNIVRAGFLMVASVNIFVVFTLHLIRDGLGAVSGLVAGVFMAGLGGALGAALAFVLLPLYESIFSFVTPSKLLELSNSDSDIFRQMAIEAPGSYHHSLIVASLAEKAAEALKLDPLLVKTGALYHDIGKIKMPEYFIENKNRKRDIHKDLTPSMSTLVIINHVKEGVEIARKRHLPTAIREIVEQHHGNSLVRYFYQKAKEKTDPEIQKIGEETYRYPGPRPQTKEAAVVMLADSVEAASRSLKVLKEETFKRVIRDIFDSYLEDGQLDDCNFSLKDLRTLASSFLATLERIYQPRIEYPGFDFEMKQKKKPEKNGATTERNGETNDDRGSEPPKDGDH